MNAHLADNCGNCVTEERAVSVRPYLVEPAGEIGTRAYYRCQECGHRWLTSWNEDAMPEIAEGPDAA